MPNKATPGTTDQRPTWEGPPENRPAGYLPADDNPEIDRDAAGENLSDPDRSQLSDAATTSGATPTRHERIRARAYRLWEQRGRVEGSHEDHWRQAERDIDEEAKSSPDTQASSGAGPAMAEHSKDARSLTPGRQPGAYVKE